MSPPIIIYLRIYIFQSVHIIPLQGPADARNTVALAVNRPSNRIIVEAGRMGGAFGGIKLALG